MRSTLKEEFFRLIPPKNITLEEAMTYIEGNTHTRADPRCDLLIFPFPSDDEMVEVTPQHVRLRKEILDTSTRENLARRKKKAV
jgi:GTP-binding protein